MPLCEFSGCKKKLMLSDMACKCQKTFCGLHRHSEGHNCTFDFKGDHVKNLLKHMSTAILAKKVDVI
jgi:hypothetical protein